MQYQFIKLRHGECFSGTLSVGKDNKAKIICSELYYSVLNYLFIYNIILLHRLILPNGFPLGYKVLEFPTNFQQNLSVTLLQRKLNFFVEATHFDTI
jgi:hypothetical protein